MRITHGPSKFAGHFVAVAVDYWDAADRGGLAVLQATTAWVCGYELLRHLAPTSSIVPIVDLAFEHRMYLPLAAVVTLVCFGAGLGWHLLEQFNPALTKYERATRVWL